MKLFDSLINKDGVVDSPIKHFACWGAAGLVAAVIVKFVGGLLFPVLIVGGIWAGYQSWQADKRINGPDATD